MRKAFALLIAAGLFLVAVAPMSATVQDQATVITQHQTKAVDTVTQLPENIVFVEFKAIVPDTLFTQSVVYTPPGTQAGTMLYAVYTVDTDKAGEFDCTASTLVNYREQDAAARQEVTGLRVQMRSTSPGQYDSGGLTA